MKKDDKKVGEKVGKKITEAEELNQEIEELTNCWKRALADYQNLEKRIGKEKADFVKFSNKGLIQKILPVLDNFERAGGHLGDQGLDLAIKEFKRVLSEEGLEEIEALGLKYNPTEMEAVEVVDGKEAGKVVEVLQKGYRLKDRIVRPSKVKVVKFN
ncbi:nucleotide exchange factor GrpE, partial [Patescibacteria group bacterium]|nr:nucleotide exchange factor GrpE [Patescibacteria group bacterium]